jgi:hypothetical protein
VKLAQLRSCTLTGKSLCRSYPLVSRVTLLLILLAWPANASARAFRPRGICSMFEIYEVPCEATSHLMVGEEIRFLNFILAVHLVYDEFLVTANLKMIDSDFVSHLHTHD